MQEFTNGAIIVRYDKTICSHAGECVRGLPSVFDVTRTPWIDVNAASAEAIGDVVRRCPSGALRCEPGDD
jgi:uncharacterized Fe-S cluster protein YjdI